MKNPLNFSRQWWTIDGDDLPLAVVTRAHAVDDATLDRQQQILNYSCLYGDASSWGGRGGAVQLLPVGGRISHNVIANAVDTLTSQVTESQPRPMFVTIGGDWSAQSRARKLTQYCDAKVYETGARELCRLAVRDSVLSGLGAVRPYIEDGRVMVERIHPVNVLLDDRSCVDVMPRELFLRRVVDRYQLKRLFPEQADRIDVAPAPTARQWYAADIYADCVEVIEAWHLPSTGDSDGETDGRHVLCVDGATLVDNPYKRRRFPVCFIRPIAPQRGFWGESLVQRAASAQLELNKLLRRVQESMHLHAVPRVFVSRQSGVTKAHLVNDIGTVVEYDGAPPIFMTPPSMSGEVYGHIDRLTRWIFEELGVSQLSATSQKPAGLNSGIALRTYNDVQSRRFINLGRGYEQLYVDLAREIVALETELAEADPSHEVLYEQGGAVERIEWRQIDLEDNAYRLQVFPASALPQSPAGKLQMLEEMLSRGTIDNETFLRLLDVPDFESVRDNLIGPEELLMKAFERILDGGEYFPPEPSMDLQRGIALAGRTLQSAQLRGAPEERLSLLRQWVGDAASLLERGAAAAEAEAQAAQAPPPGAMDPAMMDPAMAPPATMMEPPMEPGMMMPPGIVPAAE